DLEHKQRLRWSIRGEWALDGGAGAGRKRAGARLGERAPTGGVRGRTPAGTQLGDLGSASSALGQDGQPPLASRALLASDRGDATPSGGTRLGSAPAGTRQTSHGDRGSGHGDRGSGHAYARAPDLWGAQVWQALRSSSGQGGLSILLSILLSI